MSLINTPVVLTSAQKAAIQIKNSITNLHNNMKTTYNSNYTLFWSDPINIAAALGTDTASLFQLSQVLVNAVNTAQSGSISNTTSPSQYNVVLNPDGSVTISLK